MLESENYLLNSKFTGTVNHLPVLVERYHRNKEAWRASIKENEPLAAFCLKLQGKKGPFIAQSNSSWSCFKQRRSFNRCRKFENFFLEGPPNEKDEFFFQLNTMVHLYAEKFALSSQRKTIIMYQQKSSKTSKSYASPMGTSKKCFRTTSLSYIRKGKLWMWNSSSTRWYTLRLPAYLT